MKLRCAVLDDFQGVAMTSADWTSVLDRVEVVCFTEPFATARRLRVLCEAYGLADRLAILPALNLVKQLAPMKLRYWQPIPPRTGAAHA